MKVLEKSYLVYVQSSYHLHICLSFSLSNTRYPYILIKKYANTVSDLIVGAFGADKAVLYRYTVQSVNMGLFCMSLFSFHVFFLFLFIRNKGQTHSERQRISDSAADHGEPRGENVWAAHIGGERPCVLVCLGFCFCFFETKLRLSQWNNQMLCFSFYKKHRQKKRFKFEGHWLYSWGLLRPFCGLSLGLNVCANSCLLLCGPAINWSLVQALTLPSPNDNWESLQVKAGILVC